MTLRLGEQDILCQIIGGAESTILPFIIPKSLNFLDIPQILGEQLLPLLPL